MVEAILSANPKKGRTGKRKTKNSGHPSDRPTGGKSCLLYGPGHSIEEYKVTKDYSSKYAVHRPKKEEARSGGKKKQFKTVQFDGTTEEVKIMTARDAPIPRNK